jgi:hypothetical protein
LIVAAGIAAGNLFGIAIYRFRQALVGEGIRDGAPREVGLFLISLDTLAIMRGLKEAEGSFPSARAAPHAG